MQDAQTVEAIYENGVLRPLHALEDLAEHTKVTITIVAAESLSHSLLEFAGILSDEEAQDLQQTIENEFKRVDLNAW